MLDICESPLSITLRLERGLMLASFVDDQKMSTLSYQDSVLLLLQMSDALCYAHRCGLVHDDVKPENIMWSPSMTGVPAQAVLIDFGASFVSSGDDSIDFVLSGTPSYVAPEFLIKQKSPAVDMWALGVTILFATGVVNLPDGDWMLPNVFVEGDARSELQDWHASLAEATRTLSTAEEKKLPARVTVRIELLLKRLLEPDPKRRVSSLEVCRTMEPPAYRTGFR
jgi:serine/threonine protein kinase